MKRHVQIRIILDEGNPQFFNYQTWIDDAVPEHIADRRLKEAWQRLEEIAMPYYMRGILPKTTYDAPQS